ncbi:hypothetical protein EJB05_10291 [Eragrostis curvula]|uniref:Replication protein A OB domain-containing protein n=1 Tax=Eragrostis curvula TaxID=38414 RepID=A0A5J9W760_9POAL|nr:hypothetical protein EJB05_10291 [Eragrostis curvula]
MITEVSDVETVHLTNQPGPTNRRALTLRDASNYELKLFMYGQRASEFDGDEVIHLGQQEPVIAIFVGLLVKPYHGGTSLSANSACRWYINLDLPEINSFVNGLDNVFQPVVRINPVGAAQAAQEPLPEPELKELAELAAISPYDFPRQGFRSIVTVSRINDRASWFFPSCNRCNKKCLPEGSGFRYKICLFATDGTAEAEFVFFGDVGRRLVRKEIKHLMRSVGDSGDMPSEIATLVGQKYQLSFTVTSRSFQRMERSYQVKQIVCGYGRQTTIPALRPPPPRDDMPGSSSTSIALPATSAAQLTLATAPPAPQLTAVITTTQINDSTPPPPQVSPSQTTVAAEKQTLQTQPADIKDKRARRRLFKDTGSSDQTTDSLVDDDLADELTDDEAAGNKDDVSTDPIAPKGTKKAAPAKKSKKN